ncbi:unnamed protein product [Cuscuta epithymum]|uniref:Uncharacterized protein n=1 Tax=Cuscuta epithymum TaxID=186058 RepID=A0AAV0CBH6_9ASTE|nr:unnamed protein product [Cuscuta epithymum]
MRTLHLHQLHRVPLKPEIHRCPQPGVAKSVPVSLAGFHREQRSDFIADLGVLAIDDKAVWPGNGAAAVQNLSQGLVAFGVPIAQEDVEVLGWGVEGDGDEGAAVDVDGAVAASSAVEGGGGEVKVAPDLVLDLELVGEVGGGRDGAHGPGSAVHPGVLPLLDATPREEQRLVEVVEDVDDDVVVGGAVDPGARELAVDEDPLLGDAHGGDCAVPHLPRVHQVWVLSSHASPPQTKCHQHHQHRPANSSLHHHRHIYG